MSEHRFTAEDIRRWRAEGVSDARTFSETAVDVLLGALDAAVARAETAEAERDAAREDTAAVETALAGMAGEGHPLGRRVRRVMRQRASFGARLDAGHALVARLRNLAGIFAGTDMRHLETQIAGIADEIETALGGPA